MAKYKKGKDAKYAEQMESDDEAENVIRVANSKPFSEDNIAIHETIFNICGEPVTAIRPSMLPDDLEDGVLETFDQCGFRIDGEIDSDDLTPLETPQQRTRWLAHIEFSHDIESEITWSTVDVGRLDRAKTIELVREIGIAHSMRPFLWPRFCGAKKKQDANAFTYKDVLDQSVNENPKIITQIDKDLLRTLPNNVCFAKHQSRGIISLRSVLRAVSYMYPDIGYCQGMGVVVATLLLFCSEEATFWMMATLIEDIFPSNYYSKSLIGLQADERVARQLLESHSPELHKLLRENDVDMSLLSVNWLLTAFASVFPIRVLLRVWDYLFIDGGATIFRVMLSILKMKEEELLALRSSESISAELFNALSQVPANIKNPSSRSCCSDHLIEICTSFEFSITPELIESLRRRHQAILLAHHGLIINPNSDTNLPKQRVQRREFARSKNFLHHLFTATKEQKEEKIKNIQQTELIVDLRDAVLNACWHFIECDASFQQAITLQADYSCDSGVAEDEEFYNQKRRGYRRARALLDFERKDEDELGFKKNDIITVICEKDEHCWVGELNGLCGWFPAKFVEVVDERSKCYSIYGDEAVHPEVTEKIRGRLAQALKAILEHGLRKQGVLNFAAHPWLFIEEIAQNNIQDRFKAVNSRLTLCNTFSLDQDGKVLNVKELLFRAVQLINQSHNAAVLQMDVKLRSLIVIALNEQCLHLWFDLLCSCPAQDLVRRKYYHSWSFLRTPAWRQLKTTFLNQYGLQKPSVDANSLNENVRDMLIKHHLFSWDL